MLAIVDSDANEVDRDRHPLSRDRERRRLPGRRHQSLEQWSGERPHVQPRQHPVGERDELQPEPIGAALVSLDEPLLLERRQQARGGAGVDPDPAPQLADAEAGVAGGERIEQRERARDRTDGTGGRRLHAGGARLASPATGGSAAGGRSCGRGRPASG